MSAGKRAQNRAARERAILEAALVVYARDGYSGATMDAIAQAANLSKPTLYAYFATKDALFQAMMASKRDTMLAALDVPSEGGLVRTLHRFAWAYAETVMRPDMLSLARLVIAEAERQPDVGASYQQAGPDRLLGGLMTWMQAQRSDGLLCFDDAELAAQDFWGLILSAPRTQALYRPDALPGRNEIARYLQNGLAVFLKAYATDPDTALNALSACIAADQKTGGCDRLDGEASEAQGR